MAGASASQLGRDAQAQFTPVAPPSRERWGFIQCAWAAGVASGDPSCTVTSDPIVIGSLLTKHDLGCRKELLAPKRDGTRLSTKQRSEYASEMSDAQVGR